MSRAARRHVVGNDVSTMRGFASADAPVEASDARDTEPTVDPREPAWKRSQSGEPPAWRKLLSRVRFPARKAPSIDPTLPVDVRRSSRSSIPSVDAARAVVRPAASSRPCSRCSASARSRSTRRPPPTRSPSFHDAAHFLERQLMYVAVGGFAMWVGARIDYRRLKALDVSAARHLAAVARRRARHAGAERREAVDPARPADVPARRDRQARARHLSRVLARPQGRSGQDVHRRLRPAPRRVRHDDGAAAQAARPRLVGRARRDDARHAVHGRHARLATSCSRCSAPRRSRITSSSARRGACSACSRTSTPTRFANKEAYQFIQARLAIGSGGLSGAGLGDGHQTLGYMPEAHNDFILAPIGEEMGWIGIALVLAAVRILRLARHPRGARRARRVRRLPRVRHHADVRRAGAVQRRRRARRRARTRASRCRSSATVVARS